MGKNNSSPTSYFCGKLYDNIIKIKNRKKPIHFEIPKYKDYNKLLIIKFVIWKTELGVAVISTSIPSS